MHQTKVYAGIGSRETPQSILVWMESIGRVLDNHGWTLRSGGAEGADSAFERGHLDHKEIFLPWKNFNDKPYPVVPLVKEAYELAKKFHPGYNYLKPGGQALMARNGYQVLGSTLKEPSSFIICYTPNGNGGGGTGQAIRIAEAYNIPILDLGRFSFIDIKDKTAAFIFYFDMEAAQDIKNLP